MGLAGPHRRLEWRRVVGGLAGPPDSGSLDPSNRQVACHSIVGTSRESQWAQPKCQAPLGLRYAIEERNSHLSLGALSAQLKQACCGVTQPASKPQCLELPFGLHVHVQYVKRWPAHWELGAPYGEICMFCKWAWSTHAKVETRQSGSHCRFFPFHARNEERMLNRPLQLAGDHVHRIRRLFPEPARRAVTV